MKIAEFDERVHVLDAQSNVWSVIRDIAESGAQEDAFYVCDIGDIVRKHKIWRATLPRVKPYYGMYKFVTVLYGIYKIYYFESRLFFIYIHYNLLKVYCIYVEKKL